MIRSRQGLKKGISNEIHHTVRFFEGKIIHNNIRLVLAPLDYSELILQRDYILFLYFYKAFDSAGHTFIVKTLHFFGFGEKCISVLGVLYNRLNSSVLLGHGTGTDNKRSAAFCYINTRSH